MQTYFLLAFLTVGTMGMSNAAVGYLNYPTQVIFKCCKLIPVMIGGILIQGIKTLPYSRYTTLPNSTVCIKKPRTVKTF